jgi:hypothetical protein
MILSRVRHAIPWRIVLLLALVLCLPLLAFWGWFRWEVPPLQRYYLAAYWHSSEAAKEPGTQTQVQWLMKTAPGRKDLWCIDSDVTEGNQDGLPLKLSPSALQRGWIGIEPTSVQSLDSVELNRVLREIFFHGLSLRQLANEPLTYGVAAWLIVAYLAFMMRQDLAYERARLLRAVGEPEWGSYTRAHRPENQEVISSRIRSRIDQWIAQMNGPLKWANLKAVINRRSGLDNTINSETSKYGDRPASTGVQAEVPTARQLPDPLPLRSPESPSHRRTIFPGSSSSDSAYSQSKPWDESEWID